MNDRLTKALAEEQDCRERAADALRELRASEELVIAAQQLVEGWNNLLCHLIRERRKIEQEDRGAATGG